AGHAIVLHPDEVHDGRAGAEGGFRYRMLYLEPRLVQEALGYRRPLPFVRTAVSTDARLLRALRTALRDMDRRPEELETDGAVLASSRAPVRWRWRGGSWTITWTGRWRPGNSRPSPGWTAMRWRAISGPFSARAPIAIS